LHLVIIVPLSLLLFSARPIWPQETPSASKTPIRFASPAAQCTAAPKAGIRFNSPYEELPVLFAPNRGSLLVRFRSFDVADIIPLSKNYTPKQPWQFTKMDKPQIKANQFVAHAPTEWLTYPNPQNTVHYRAPDWGDALQYYGRRIPWAGRIMLEVGKQAESHPRVFRIFELIDPGLSLGKPPSYHR
jgi:hypothetical protein